MTSKHVIPFNLFCEEQQSCWLLLLCGNEFDLEWFLNSTAHQKEDFVGTFLLTNTQPFHRNIFLLLFLCKIAKVQSYTIHLGLWTPFLLVKRIYILILIWFC